MSGFHWVTLPAATDGLLDAKASLIDSRTEWFNESRSYDRQVPCVETGEGLSRASVSGLPLLHMQQLCLQSRCQLFGVAVGSDQIVNSRPFVLEGRKCFATQRFSVRQANPHGINLGPVDDQFVVQMGSG